jgi:DNA-binding response OmpR family regulator
MNENSLSLLLVDDEETFVKVLAMHLRDNYGYKTAVVFSGRDAIHIIENSSTGFDVILLDYLMPDMNGLNVLQWMLEQKNETPVIILTAAGSEQVAVEALKLGAYDYVRKELVDIEHLDILIRGTHERHLYRITETMEGEKQNEMALNEYATDLVRLMINAVSPTLNTALAQLAGSIENDPEALLTRLPENDRDELKKILGDIQRNVRLLETATRGLMRIFELVYAHHSEIPDIKNLNNWFHKELSIPQN